MNRRGLFGCEPLCERGSHCLKRIERCAKFHGLYRASHALVDLGWVEFDFGVPPAAQPLLPESHQPRQNQADSGTLKIQVNKTQSTSTWDTL